MQRKWKTLALVTGVTIVLTPVIAIFRLDQESSHRANVARAELRSYGHATNLAELKALAPEPKDNAAPFYLPLIDGVVKRNLGREMGAKDKPLTPKEIAMLDREKAFLDRAKDVRQRPRLWFDRPYEQGWLVTMPEMSSMKTLQELLGRRAILDAQRGDAAIAVDRLVTMTAVAEHLSQDPFVIGGLVSRSAFNIRDRDAIWTASRLEQPEDRYRVRLLIESVPARFELRKYMGGEAYAYSLNKDLDTELLGDSPAVRAFYSLPFMKRRLAAVNLELIAEIARLSHDGISPEDIKRVEEFEKRDTGFLDKLVPRLGPMLVESFLYEVQENHRDVVLAALDVLVERAGGAPAKMPFGVRLERKDDRFATVNLTRYVEVSPDRVVIGDSRKWKGFGP